jgi:hypothetical protein
MANDTATNDGLVTRRLAKADFDRGFLQLLAQLSVVGDVDRATFEGERASERARRCKTSGASNHPFQLKEDWPPTHTHKPTARFDEIDANPDYHVFVIEGVWVCVCLREREGGAAELQPLSRRNHPPPIPSHPHPLHPPTDPSDPATNALLGAATLLIERKFLRGCGTAGHIEDVVVDAAARGKKLGARLISALSDAAKEAGCYKVILDCSEGNVAFYEKCGLSRKEVQMVRYF